MLPLLLVACGLPQGAAPEPTLDSAAIEVLSALERVVERAGQDPAGAAAAVTQAVSTFEANIEPLLRRSRPPREVLALEVGFSHVRAAVLAGKDPAPAVADLGERLRQAVEMHRE